MKYLLILFIMIVSVKSFALNQNLNQMFSTPTQIISGVTYPQNSKVLYSGSFKKRMSSGQAINAMLGSPSIYFQSKAFNNIVSCLLKKKSICSKDIIKYWDPLLLGKVTRRRNFIISQIQKQRGFNNGRFEDYTKAQEKAVIIIDEYFNWLGKYQLLNNFIKYKYTILDEKAKKSNGQDIAWPSELIYASLQSYTSALYGPRTIIFKDHDKRSLDIGYWNFLNSGYWYNTQRDMGEFITAGHIPGKDIVGYQIRSKMGGTFKPSKSGFGKRWSPEFHQIEYAFYKDQIDGIDIVLVFSGNLRACIIKTASFEYSYCNDPSFKLIKPTVINQDKYQNDSDKREILLGKLRKDPNRYPQVNKYQKAKLIGFYVLESQEGDLKKVYNYYPQQSLSKREAKSFQRKVNKTNLLSIKFYPMRIN